MWGLSSRVEWVVNGWMGGMGGWVGLQKMITFFSGWVGLQKLITFFSGWVGERERKGGISGYEAYEVKQRGNFTLSFSSPEKDMFLDIFMM